MRILLHIAFIMLCLSAQAQGWRDTLDLARKAYKQENYGQALEYYEKVQKTAPESLDLTDEMGQSAYKLREFEKAEKIYQQGGGNKQSKDEKADNFHNLGNTRMKQKKYQQAAEAYKEALRLRPDDNETRYNLSEAIRKLKEQEKKQGGGGEGSQNNDSESAQNGGEPQNNNAGENGDAQGENASENDQTSQGKNRQPSNGKPSQPGGNLPNNTVERMLDDLTKAEAETKRKLTGGKSFSNAPKSGKDW